MHHFPDRENIIGSSENLFSLLPLAGDFFVRSNQGKVSTETERILSKRTIFYKKTEIFSWISKENSRNLWIVSIEINRGGDIINYQKTMKEEFE